MNLKDETVWLNRQQIATLFNRDIKTIGKHINNSLNEELLDDNDRKTYQVEYYNLDVIISVGYRVKSKNSVTFRR